MSLYINFHEEVFELWSDLVSDEKIVQKNRL